MNSQTECHLAFMNISLFHQKTILHTTEKVKYMYMYNINAAFN